MPEPTGWEHWHPSTYGGYDGRRCAKRWREDHADQGGRGVAHRGGGHAFDSGRDFRPATNNSRQQPDAAQLQQAVLLGIERQHPKPKAPRLKAATPEA